MHQYKLMSYWSQCIHYMCEYDMCKLEVSAGVIETPSPTYQAEQQQKMGVSFIFNCFENVYTLKTWQKTSCLPFKCCISTGVVETPSPRWTTTKNKKGTPLFSTASNLYTEKLDKRPSGLPFKFWCSLTQSLSQSMSEQ